MECLNGKSDVKKRKKLTPSVRNEIVRDLVTTMYAYMPNPNKAFCTMVAKLLVESYSFLKDVGANVTGYVIFRTQDIGFPLTEFVMYMFPGMLQSAATLV